MNIRGSKGHEKTTSGQDDLYLNNLTVYDSTILEGPVSLKRQNTLQNPLLNQVNLLIPNYEFVSYNFEFPASSGTLGQVFVSGGGSSPNYWVTPGSGGIGTVTSVGVSTPSLFTVTGSPITTSGTISLTYSGTPLPILYGGTGLTAVGTSGQVLQSNGSTLIYTTPGSGGIGTVTSVSVTVPSFMNVTPSTITTSGTFAITASSTGTGDVVLNSNPNILNLSTEGSTAYAEDDGSAAITSAGGVHIDGNMFMSNENRTTDTGIIGTYAVNTRILGGTISASAPVSYPGIYGVYIQGEPEAGENVTIVEVPHLSLGSFALGVDGGALIDNVVLSGDMKILGLSSFLGDITIGVTYVGATPVKSTAVQFLDAEITYDGTSFTYYYGSASRSLLAITSVDLNTDTRLYLPKISWSNYTGVYPDILYTDLMSLAVAETDAGQVASFTMGNSDTQFLQTLCYPFFAPPFWGTIYGTGETYITPDNNLMNIGVSSEGTVFTAEIVWNSSITGGYENMAIGSETGVGPFITMYSALDVELFSVVPDYFYFNALDFFVGYNTDNPADVLVEKVYIYSTLSCDIKTFTGTLSLTTTTGSLALTTGAGAMSFTTGGGTMDLTTGAGAMTVNTGGGDLSFDLGAGTTNFNTGGGDMSFDMGAGSINFNMGAGIMAFDIGAGGWTVNAAAGEVLFDLGAGGFNTNIVNGEYKLVIDTFTGVGDAITLSSLDYTGGGDAIHLEVGTYQGAGDAIALVVTDCNVAGNGIKLETSGFLGAGDSIFISADSYAGIGDAIAIISSAYAGTGKAVNIESTISGDVNVQAGLGNVTISSNSGAVKIDAPSGGLVIGTAGYNHGVGNMTVYAGNGAFSTQTGNISFTTLGYATYTGPGNFTIDTTLAYVGNIYMLAKGGISMKSYGGTYTLSLDTHYMTASYSWNYPATAGTIGYVLLSGGGVSANYWSSALTLDSVALRSSSGAYTITLSGYDATASYTFYFPPTKGTANQLLTTDGSGNSSFTSNIIVNSVTTPTITYAAADMKISSAFNVDLDSSGTGGYGVIVGYNTSKISGLGYPFTIYNNATDRTIMMQAVSKGTGIANQYIAINTPVELGASTGSAGQVFTSQGTTSAPIWTNASAGTVTSIGITVPSFMAVTPSTITSSGIFTITATTTGANSIVLRDANQNVSANSFINGVQSYTSSSTAINLTVSSSSYIVITGTSTQIINLPDATTLSVGQTFFLNNNSTLATSVYAHDGTTSIKALPAGGYTQYTLTNNGTTNGIWDTHSTLSQSTTSGTSLFNSSAAIQTSSTFNIQASSYVTAISGAFATGSYNFNLPATAGTAGQILTSQGGGSNAMTWSTVGSGYVVQTYTSSTTAIVLTASSSNYLVITGSVNQSIQLPDATTLTNGKTFFVNNTSSATTSVITFSTSIPIGTIPAGGTIQYVLTSNSTADGTWNVTPYLSQGSVITGSSPFITSTTPIALKSTTLKFIQGSYTTSLGVGNPTSSFTFTLPDTPGTAGQPLLSGAGSTTTWGSTTGTGNFVLSNSPTLVNASANSLTLSTPLAVTSGGTGVITSTGTGNVVLSNSPTLVSPTLGNAYASTLLLGTPLAVTNGGTGVITSTGTGSNVLSTSPTLVTPTLGVASATSLTLSTPLAVTSGGTGVTTSTGTGSVVLNTSPSLQTLTNKGTLTLSQLVGSSTISIACPSSGVTSYNITLPTTSGTINYPLVTDGTGTTSWAPITGTGMYVY